MGSKNQILLKSANKIAAFRLNFKGQYIDYAEFNAVEDKGPNVLTDSILGNYSEELFQLIIVDISNKKRKVQVPNTETYKCDKGHDLQKRDDLYLNNDTRKAVYC